MVAKAVGIRVHEFSLGFGPKLFGMPRGETTYNLRLLPLGGFVRMAGMDPEEEVEDERGFNKKPVYQRIGVILAGPLMNFLLAAVLLAVIFMTQGLPMPTTKVDKLLPGQPAERAGVQAGDKIVAIDGRPVDKWADITATINGRSGEKVTLTLQKEGQVRNVEVVPAADQNGQGKIGIYPAQEPQRLGPLASLAVGVEYTVRLTAMIIDFIGQMIFGKAPADLGGPVRVVREIGVAVEYGFYRLLQLAAILSVNLGLFNLFPIPALDGSRIVFLGFEGLRGRPVDPKKENFIHLVGFGLLLLLIVVITYNDILQLL